MDYSLRIRGDEIVHEVEEIDAPASFVMAADNFAARTIEGGEQHSGHMALVIIRLCGHDVTIGLLRITLLSVERLDRRAFVDRQSDGVPGGRHVEPDDFGRLANALGVVAFAPPFAAGHVDIVGAQVAPNILRAHIAERSGDEWSRPVGVALRRVRVAQRPNAAVRLDPVFGLGAALGNLRKASEAVPRIAHGPLRRRSGRATERAPNHPRRRAIDSSQHDLRLHSRAAFRPDRARQALQFGAFITRQRNPRRSRKVVDAALNYFSPKCDSGY